MPKKSCFMDEKCALLWWCPSQCSFIKFWRHHHMSWSASAMQSVPSWIWDSTAPNPWSLVSMSTINCSFNLGYAKTGTLHSCCFNEQLDFDAGPGSVTSVSSVILLHGQQIINESYCENLCTHFTLHWVGESCRNLNFLGPSQYPSQV